MFGIGNLPIMPGTWCSLIVAIPALFVPYEWIDVTRLIYGILAIVLTIASVWSVRRVQDMWGHDPSIVVVDEAAAMSLVLLLPFAYWAWYWWCGAVLLFRIYDVQKPWPISLLNNRTEPWSVVADDLVAAVFTVLTLQLGMLALQVLALGSLALSA